MVHREEGEGEGIGNKGGNRRNAKLKTGNVMSGMG